MQIVDVILITIIGIIEGVTEWLPVSSTGHMMIFEHFFSDAFTEGFFTSDFKDMFEYLIQLGAIIAVICVFWKRVFPFSLEKREKTLKNGETVLKTAVISNPSVWKTWLKVLVACIPAVTALVVDKLFDKLGATEKIIVVGSMLVLYGVAFIVIEYVNKNKKPRVETVDEMSLLNAFLIGCFQVLAAVPGTSRSGVTIIGGLILGLSRTAAAEFTFFLAIPTMVGASGYKILKFVLNGGKITTPQISALILGMVIAFVVSLAVIKFLMDFVKKHDFRLFGWYRIALGALVIILCLAV
mgnify:CR=1 FL=1